MAAPADIRKITDTVGEFPTTHRNGMRVPARLCAIHALLSAMDDGVFDQISGVACLPGIVGSAWCMPDGRWGYGFPIGGTAAFDPESGVISPSGFGFDISCGMRVAATSLSLEEVRPRLAELMEGLFLRIPAGVAKEGCAGIGAAEKDNERHRARRYSL